MAQQDDFPEAPERAIKYTYDFENDKWDREKVFVQFAQQPFAAGGMRVCYKMKEVEMAGSGQIIAKSETLVAKMFMKKVRPEVYFDEAMTQMLAESYAQEFNKWPLKRKITFLPVNVYQLRERGGQLVNVEPMMQGKYVKHNDNDGNVETDDELPQAFSHFSWEASDHQLLIVDIQGVGDFYTDPQVHSYDGESFGQGNLGMEGVNSFLKSHTCNTLCRALNLPLYAQGRLMDDSKGTKPARINMDAKRSNSPLRWGSGSEYEKGLSRAMGSMDEDDGTGAGRGGGGGGRGGRIRLQSDPDGPAPSGGGGGRMRPQSDEGGPPPPARGGRARPESGLDDGLGGGGRARPQSGLDDAPAPRARVRPESMPDDGPSPAPGRGGRSRYESDAGADWGGADYRGPGRRDSGGGGARRDPSPEGPLVRGGASGGGKGGRTSISPVARVRAVPVDGDEGGRGRAEGDPSGSARTRSSVSPVARLRGPDGGSGSGSGSSGKVGPNRGLGSASEVFTRRDMANGRAAEEQANLPAPQKFVSGRRSSAVDPGAAMQAVRRSGSFSAARDGVAGLSIQENAGGGGRGGGGGVSNNGYEDDDGGRRRRSVANF